MTQKNQPTGIRNIVIIGLAVLLCLVWMIAADRVNAEPITLNQDTRMPNTQCANGLWGLDGCLPGFEIFAPRINFTDLESGQATGLGDGLGDGAIVTVWGQNLGSAQGNSTIQFVDSSLTARTGHVYYWKNADGTLPGGPANLYASHRMQEIAFSIPAGSATGLGMIRVNVNGQQYSFPFTVRTTGSIKYVAPGGNNSNPCSYAQPCAYINGDINPGSGNGGIGNSLSAGDIVYSRGVLEPYFQNASDSRYSGMYLRSAVGDAANQIAIVAYPDNSNFSRVVTYGYGVQPYLSSAIVVSKYLISTGHADPSSPPAAGLQILSDVHIGASPDGRAVGNKMVQNANTCFTGQAGSIESGGNSANNYQILGNHFEELGCDNSSRYQHTLYMSVRNEAASPAAPTIAYNYLDNNNVLNGIHVFDQAYTGDCGNMTGTLKVNNNVIINQRGAGISISANDFAAPINFCWSADIEVDNNVLINVGQGVAAEDNVINPNAIVLGGGINSSTVKVRNNTVYGWGENFTSGGINQEGFGLSIVFSLADPVVTVANNSFVQNTTNTYLRWFNGSEPNQTVTNTNFWNIVTNSGNSNPTYPGNIVSDPLYTINGSQLILSPSSPLINAGSTPVFSVDIYGKPVGTNVGAIQ